MNESLQSYAVSIVKRATVGIHAANQDRAQEVASAMEAEGFIDFEMEIQARLIGMEAIHPKNAIDRKWKTFAVGLVVADHHPVDQAELFDALTQADPVAQQACHDKHGVVLKHPFATLSCSEIAAELRSVAQQAQTTASRDAMPTTGLMLSLDDGETWRPSHGVRVMFHDAAEDDDGAHNLMLNVTPQGVILDLQDQHNEEVVRSAAMFVENLVQLTQ